jgi:lysophospholipase L1-like esterase
MISGPRRDEPGAAALQLLAALPLMCLLASCGDSPGGPSGTGPKLSCPASLSQTSSGGASLSVVYPLPTVSGGLPPLVGPTCTPPTGSSFPTGVSAVACTVTDSQARSDLCTFTITVTLPPKLAATNFLAFGDSITYGEDGANNVAQGFDPRRLHPSIQLTGRTYPDDLQAELHTRYTLQGLRVVNGGVRGESVIFGTPSNPSGMARFGLVSAGTYDVALLMEGANDLGNIANGTTTYAAIMEGFSAMIDHARAVGMRPFLATIPPENPDPPMPCDPSCRGVDGPIVPAFNDQVRALAAAKNVPLVDVYLAFNGDLSLIGPDGLHPTATGYQVIADAFFGAFKQNLEVGVSPSSIARMPLLPASRRR